MAALTATRDLTRTWLVSLLTVILPVRAELLYTLCTSSLVADYYYSAGYHQH